MNDPLYNHPAWKSTEGDNDISGANGGGERGGKIGGGDVAKLCSSDSYLENVVTEIIISKFTDPTPKVVGGGERTEEGGNVEDTERAGTVEGQGVMKSDGLKKKVDLKDSERTETGVVGKKEGVEDSERAVTGGMRKEESVGEVRKEESVEGVEGRSGHAESRDRNTTKGEEVKDDTPEGTGETNREEIRLDSISEEEIDPDCTECKLLRPPPSPRQLFMCLHALAYKVDN